LPLDFQLRVVLRQREYPAHSGADLAFGCKSVLVRTSTSHLRTQRRQSRQEIPLVPEISLDRVDQLPQFVGALLEQHVDVRPRLIDIVFHLHEAVVDRRRVRGDTSDHEQKNEGECDGKS
jgi:hypothetical protein